MATWKTPEINHTVEDQVTPEIFNTLAENEVYLNETKITTNQVQEATVMSEVSTTRTNLTSSDTIMGAFSKIRKWFADLKALAFKDTVATADIDNSAVTEAKIAAGAVTTDKIGATAVTTAKIADYAVTSAKLGTSSVLTAKINALAVTTAKIASAAVTTVKIADLNVTTAKIAALAVTADKLAASAVTVDKIADGAVTDAKVTDVSASKITGLATVATSGSYNDLTNKPSISSFTMTRGTYRTNYQYNIPSTGLYLVWLKWTNNAGYTSVSCLGNFSNKTGQINPSYSSISSIYYEGTKTIQLRCEYVSSTALKYFLYISSSATTAPNTLWDDYDGTIEIIMYKISSFSAIS